MLSSVRSLVALGAQVALVGHAPDTIDWRDFREHLGLTGIEASEFHLLSSTERDHPQRLPIDDIFTADSCVIDLDNADQFRFVADLPVHTWPAARLVGDLSRLSTFSPPIAREILERLDTVAGSTTDTQWLGGDDRQVNLTATFQEVMRTANLRLALIRDNQALHLISRHESRFSEVGRTSPDLLALAAFATATRLDFDATMHLASQG